MPGKYACPRDEALHFLTTAEWSNESSGDVASPAGWFARISNDPADLGSILDVLDDNLPDDFDPEELVGHFLLVEDDQGFVEVTSFDTHQELLKDYQGLEEQYAAWATDSYV